MPWPTILVALFIAALMVLAFYKLYKSHKNGECCGGCSGCAKGAQQHSCCHCHESANHQ